MKTKIAILAFFVFGMSSCAYKTCPTYAKKGVKQQLEQKAETSSERAS